MLSSYGLERDAKKPFIEWTHCRLITTENPISERIAW
jgi:hypothetical protein